jgi:hypothetical protein
MDEFQTLGLGKIDRETLSPELREFTSLQSEENVSWG